MIAGERESLQRLILLAFSAIVIELPQSMLAIFGYGSVLVIAIETLLVVGGFLIAAGAVLIRKPNQKLTDTQTLLMAVLIIIGPMIFELMLVQVPNLTGILLILASVLIAFVLASYNFFNPSRHGNPSILVSYAIVAILVIGIGLATWMGTPEFPTDEIAINMYASHLILGGINPYIASNMAGVFAYYGFSSGYYLSFSTPLTTGGFVTALGYPALSFLYFIPANLLKVNGALATIPLYFLPPFITIYAFGKRNITAGILASLFIIANPQYFFQIRMGYLDVLWISLVMLSVLWYRKPVLSAVAFGLALSVKQDPIFVVPFMIILIYNEMGGRKTVAWILGALITFFAINSYFFAKNPYSFLSSLLLPVTKNLIGIGFGPSQLSFLNIYPLPAEVFGIMTIASLLLFIIIYIMFYQRLKFIFLLFSILMYLFNYRLLLEYVMFWPLIAFIVMSLPQYWSELKSAPRKVWKNRTRITRIAFSVICILLILTPVAASLHYSSSSQRFLIQNPEITGVSGKNVTEMQISISMVSPDNATSPVLFRIMYQGMITDSNGLLWVPLNNSTRISSMMSIISIIPEGGTQRFNASGTYTIIAYYGNTIGSYSFHLN